MTMPKTADRRFSFFGPSKFVRRPRVIADRRARAAMSRDARWKRRGSSPMPKVLAAVAAVAVAAGLWLAFKPVPTPDAPPLAFPDFVASANLAFPEALAAHTRAAGGTLADGHVVPVGVSLLVPAHTLDSPAAAADALTRLSAPFVGKERTISGPEMGARIEGLAGIALPQAVSRCYSYSVGDPQTVAQGEGRTVRVRPLDITFNPEC